MHPFDPRPLCENLLERGCAPDSTGCSTALKILLGSHFYFPSTGGIETVTDLLAREFVCLGHDVRVVTMSEGDLSQVFPVIRRPSLVELFRQVQWCDVF